VLIQSFRADYPASSIIVLSPSSVEVKKYRERGIILFRKLQKPKKNSPPA
jgi:hypothetical protein